ncbi:beta family protein [Glycocaulis sp.]|uniref:beta family protein n=1 Tax=Glycocaulis sp. TaxID=1969725 RepID=UPI003D2143B1
MFWYSPALRFKQGEYLAAARVAPDIRKHLEPRFIIPSLKDVDPEKGRPLSADELAYLTAERIGKHWASGVAYLDAKYVALTLGQAGLVRLYAVAQSRNPQITALLSPSDIEGPFVRRALKPIFPRLGILVAYQNLDEIEKCLVALRRLNCSPEDCTLFIDFAGAPLEIEGVAGSVAQIFEQASAFARWGRIVFQGSSFPSWNPADAGGEFRVPRDEWRVFNEAAQECSLAPGQLMFGDYGADSSKIVFPRKGGARAIRHIRFTGTTDCVVVRGASEGTDQSVMREVCQRLVAMKEFVSPSFSYADNQINKIAHGLCGPGNASTWRELNTAHHITQVIRQLGASRGIQFSDSAAAKIEEQEILPF